MEPQFSDDIHQVIVSSDGSHTLYLPSLKETYHSTHGAIAESKHVYITNGIKTISNNPIKVLEIGFGTGLNALLTIDYALRSSLKVIYHTLEPFPLPANIYSQLNYGQLLDSQQIFIELHQADFSVQLDVNQYFSITKHIQPVLDFNSELLFDIIYFDAFAPNKQEDMWSLQVFQNLYQMLNTDGILVTYCANGQFRRNLKTAGFSVEVLPGPPGKKEMTRAVKNVNAVR